MFWMLFLLWSKWYLGVTLWRINMEPDDFRFQLGYFLGSMLLFRGCAIFCGKDFQTCFFSFAINKASKFEGCNFQLKNVFFVDTSLHRVLYPIMTTIFRQFFGEVLESEHFQQHLTCLVFRGFSNIFVNFWSWSTSQISPFSDVHVWLFLQIQPTDPQKVVIPSLKLTAKAP